MAWETDKLDREKAASYLTRLLDGSDDARVINIDSPWGTGKTYFLKNWCDDLALTHGAVYFNAWENDYSGDPFVSIVSEIKAQLQDQTADSDKLTSKFEDFSRGAAKALVAVSPVLMKAAVNGFSKKLLGVSAEDLAEEAVDQYSDTMGDVSEKLVENLINNNKKSVQAVSSFKHVMNELVAKVGSAISNRDDPVLPVYIFIDELDRCRPTYAIELLERVKHFLDVQGCRFVIATDTVQLQESIKAVYGNGFSSHMYLKRFFDLTYTLDNSDIKSWLSARWSIPEGVNLKVFELRQSDSTKERFRSAFEEPVPPSSKALVDGYADLDNALITLLSLQKVFGASLRDMERILNHLKAVVFNVRSDGVYFFWLAYLVFLRYFEPELYSEILFGDSDEAFKRLVSKYRSSAVDFYFGYSCKDLHAVAKECVDILGSDRAENSSRLNSNGHEFRHLEDFLMSVMNKSNVHEYPYLVNLGARLS
ncbi:KAP family P-loop NTPase fold protein [Salinicola endophyticus]|uniref:KAP family P-loop NTPase fold protein n=1 Tax=Salinicola endophyticus TaxID=1949083 RepID=UPI000DA19906|nr:P-loop NTPase fold protein [Salinicola endophyticus]